MRRPWPTCGRWSSCDQAECAGRRRRASRSDCPAGRAGGRGVARRVRRDRVAAGAGSAGRGCSASSLSLVAVAVLAAASGARTAGGRPPRARAGRASRRLRRWARLRCRRACAASGLAGLAAGRRRPPSEPGWSRGDPVRASRRRPRRRPPGGRPGRRAGPAGAAVAARGRRWRTRAPVAAARPGTGGGRACCRASTVRLAGRLGPARAGQPLAAVVAVRGPPGAARQAARGAAAGRVRCGPGCGAASAGLPPRRARAAAGAGRRRHLARCRPTLVDRLPHGRADPSGRRQRRQRRDRGRLRAAGRRAGSGLRGRWLPLVGGLALVGVRRAGPAAAVGAAGGGDGRGRAAGAGAPAGGGAASRRWPPRCWCCCSSTRGWPGPTASRCRCSRPAGCVLLAPGLGACLAPRGACRVPPAEALAVAAGRPAGLRAGGGPAQRAGQPGRGARRTCWRRRRSRRPPCSACSRPCVAPVEPRPARAAGAAGRACRPGGSSRSRDAGRRACPGRRSPWPGTVTGALLLAAVDVAAVLAGRVPGRRPAPAAAARRPCSAWRSSSRRRTPGWPPRGWVLVACDVGQGDALVLAVGPGTAVVVDAGPDPRGGRPVPAPAGRPPGAARAAHPPARRPRRGPARVCCAAAGWARSPSALRRAGRRAGAGPPAGPRRPACRCAAWSWASG